MKTIQTERLVLRDLKKSDWRSVLVYASDPRVVRYMTWGPNTEAETKSFIDRAITSRQERPRRIFTLAIVLRTTNALIGGCGIHVSNPDNREGWIGYCLNRHYWGKGFATVTARALVAFGFQELDLHRIFATCDPANEKSAHVLEKTGMQCEGHLREHMWAKGKWRDSLLYSVLDHEWRKSMLSRSKQERG